MQVAPVLGSYVTWECVEVVYANGTVSEVGNFTFGTHLSRDHAIFYESFGASGHVYPLDSPDNTTVRGLYIHTYLHIHNA